MESQRSFPRDAARFFSDLSPGVLGLAPSSFHRHIRDLGRFLEPLRRFVVGELVGDPETLLVDSTLLSVLHPGQVKQFSEGWGRPASGALQAEPYAEESALKAFQRTLTGYDSKARVTRSLRPLRSGILFEMVLYLDRTSG